MTRCTDGSNINMIQTRLVSGKPALNQNPYCPCAPLCLLPPNISTAERRRGTPLGPANEDIHSECTLFWEGDIHHFLEQSRCNRIRRVRATEQVRKSILLLSVLSVAGVVQHRTSLRSSSIDFGSTVPADAVSEITNNCNSD